MDAQNSTAGGDRLLLASLESSRQSIIALEQANNEVRDYPYEEKI